MTLAIPALLALAGYAIAYRNNLRLAQRKDRLDRVTSQLSDLYGPLLALSSAGNSAWAVFRSRFRPGIPSFWDSDPSPTPEEATAWRLWMTTVFAPLNREMRDLVVNRADLLEEPEMPTCLLQLCAHVAAYEPVLKQWEDGDYTEHRTPLNFPAREVTDYASASFRELKEEQNRLLARESSDREH